MYTLCPRGCARFLQCLHGVFVLLCIHCIRGSTLGFASSLIFLEHLVTSVARDKMKKSPAANQNNTLFNYFSRTPKSADKNEDKCAANSPPNLTPSSLKSSTPLASKRNGTVSSTKSLKSKAEPVEHFKSPKIAKLSGSYRIYDLVWAKLDGYPWWPSIICNDPESGVFEQKRQIHVQFFDDPVSHAWVNLRDVKPYTGSVQQVSLKSKDIKLSNAIEAAEDALNIDREERHKLIGDLNAEDYDDKETSEEMSTSNTSKLETPLKRKKQLNQSSSDDDEEKSDDSFQVNKPKRFKRIAVQDDSASEEEYNPGGDRESSDEEEEFLSDVVNSDDESFEAEEDEESSKENLSTKKKSTKLYNNNKKNKRGDDEDIDEEELSDINMDELPSTVMTPSLKVKTFKMSHDELENNKPSVKCPLFDMFDDTVGGDNHEVNQEYSVVEFSTKSEKKKKNLETSITQPCNSNEAAKQNWPHLSYKFLQPANIADANGNKMLVNGSLNPNYDSSTLYVPESFLKDLTPALRQWWQFKMHHFDTILFFKMGKFYEFFHMDAVIGSKELKILFMKGDYAHAGFPEKSYKQYAEILIRKGYKVARVEQTETPEMMNDRVKKMVKPTKFDKVVRREICRISSVGTQCLSDVDSSAFPLDYSYLMAITCKQLESSIYEFGACLVEVSVGRFYLAQFEDDRYFSKLRTLISHYTPVEILVESNSSVIKFLQAICPKARFEPQKKFMSPEKALKFIFEDNETSKKIPKEFCEKILDPSDVLQQTAKPEYELAVKSLGGVINYLNKSLIVDDILSMGQFEVYESYSPNQNGAQSLPAYMILDSMTFKNLEIFESKVEGESLFNFLDQCNTPFGRRMLRSWLAQPLCNRREELEMRQEAVRELAEKSHMIGDIKSWANVMKKLPDLERYLTQIHSNSSLKRASDHPDSRAILFDSDTYRQRRLNAFLDSLDGFEMILGLADKVIGSSLKSTYIRKLFTSKSEGGKFPDLKSKMNYFRSSFKAEQAREKGDIVPQRGADQDYDQTIENIERINTELEEYLQQQKRIFQVKIKYVNAAKNRFMLEIPEGSVTKGLKNAKEEYDLITSRKGFKRFYTDTIRELVSELEAEETKRDETLGDTLRRMLARFDADYNLWREVISCLAQLDVLISLSRTGQLFEGCGAASCLPEFVWTSDTSLFKAENLRNALLVSNSDQIGNDIELVGETLILTGPNMGGKTTLMRSVGMMAILAHLGCYVPATSCRLSPIDRIFTRIGAHDLVLENQSSFAVELNEALTIVNYATLNSLVLIDELGRGTSTYDGVATATAILTDMIERVGSRTIFSTHYQSIAFDLKDTPKVKLGFMGYMVEKDKDDPSEETVTFLYKLQEGICEKSYGFNVAKMAELPDQVVRRACMYGRIFENRREIGTLLGYFTSQDKPSLGSNSEKAKQLYQLCCDTFKLALND